MGDFINLMDVIGSEGDIELFSTEAVKVLTKYKWDSYAKYTQQVSSTVFVTYLITYFIYVNYKYNQHKWHEEEELKNYRPFCYIMFICNTFAFLYESRQAINTGWLYLLDVYNLNDFIYISSGYCNIFIEYN